MDRTSLPNKLLCSILILVSFGLDRPNMQLCREVVYGLRSYTRKMYVWSGLRCTGAGLVYKSVMMENLT